MQIITTLKTIKDLGDNIKIIVLTGGPCSGKTTGLPIIKKALEDRGYKVIISPESATKMNLSGVKFQEIDVDFFQKQVLLDSFVQEEIMKESAMAYRDKGRKVVIICDRGILDGAAYCSGYEAFENIFKDLNLSINDVCLNRYHAIMHLRTTAYGAENFYTLENNDARFEDVEGARLSDNKSLSYWKKYYNPVIIENERDFLGKMEDLLEKIMLEIEG